MVDVLTSRSRAWIDNILLPLAVTVGGTITHATLGFWYVSDNTNAAGHAGKSGAYSEGTTNTSAY